MVVVRANASTPVNMNAPSDAMRLIPYLNREQYGERALLYGPHFAARYSNINDSEDRYGRVGDRYEVVDQKISLEYSNNDKMLFPTNGGWHTRDVLALYKRWMGLNPDGPLTWVIDPILLIISAFLSVINWVGCTGGISCGISLVVRIW